MKKKQLKMFCVVGILFVFISDFYAVAPAGYYYFAKNKKKAELKTALRNFCGPQQVLDYGSGPGFSWEGFFYTDRNPDNSVMDMYSTIVRSFNGFASVNEMHIEHSFPKSWWGAHNNDAYKDLYHLYPADATTNITKSNLPLGEVLGIAILDNGRSKIGNNGFGTEYTDKCFEPADEFKGDFARSYFYISTIYENYSSAWASPMMNNTSYPVWKAWALDLLLKWHRQDPVSEKERTRIEAVYNIQGNRNPFIDYPSLVDYIWGRDSTRVFPFPDETDAFLLWPRRGTMVDFGIIMLSDTRSQILQLQGVNINADIQLSLLGNNAAFSLSALTVPMADALTGITAHISFTPTVQGLVRDTVLVQGGGLSESLRIPIVALASADFIIPEPSALTQVGARLQWMKVPDAVDYQLTLYQGDKQAGDLFIAGYVEGSAWNKAIEIYNGTGRTIDLSNYSIHKQSDGAGPFVSQLKLSGTLANNSSYVIAHKTASPGLLALAQLQTDTVLQFNGNDAVALLRNGFIIDRVGDANAGPSIYWGTDLTLKRKPTVTHPLSVFNANEWAVLPTDSWNLLGNHSIRLIGPADEVVIRNVHTGIETTCTVDNLSPQNTYTYRVSAITPTATLAAVNTAQLHTLPLDKPILMQPTDLGSTKFVARWEDVFYANGYLLTVFEISHQADTTETEAFDGVGTTGKPLPQGWSGTVSGNYTSATSAGIAPPSVGLKSNAEWLQTKVYSSPLSRISFMYKFASTATGSSLGVYALSKSRWIKVDSIVYSTVSKYYPVYNFSKNDGITSVRLLYHKSTGNLSIDDVSISYALQDTVFFIKDAPVQGTSALVEGLKENTPYYYSLKASLGNSFSSASESILLTTLLNNDLKKNQSSTLRLFNHGGGIKISGLKGDETVQIYTTTGYCIFQIKAYFNEIQLPIIRKGIYLIRIGNNESTFTGKFIN